MIIALIDNGSLAPAAHRNLRRLARAISERANVEVHAVSWKHSDRIRPASLDGIAAATLASWARARATAGERDFVFVPFFISPQGAFGSALRNDLEELQQELGPLRFTFTAGLSTRGTLAPIVIARIRETIAQQRLQRPAVIVVDHGGPSAVSATIRDAVAHEVRGALGSEVSAVTAASMEGAEHAHNQPLFAEVLTAESFDHGDVVVAPLFLAPGRHAGPRGDLAQIAIAAEDRLTASPLDCHFTELVGTHALVVSALADGLTTTLSTLSVAA